MDEDEIVTEYGIPYKSGDVQVRARGEHVERAWPLAEWIAYQGTVLRRKVIIVQDWEEVSEP